jgi:hypothetical protein
LQRLELFDGLAVAGGADGFLRLRIDDFRAGFGVIAVTAAAGSKQHDAGCHQNDPADMDKITHSHKRFLTMDGS